MQPLCNKFLRSEDEFVGEQFYPMELTFCRNCKLVQLDSVPPSNVVFGKSFNYLSGATPDRVAYFNRLAGRILRKFNLKDGEFVLDIGSNDGTLLKQFKDYGINSVLGVDPAPEPCRLANQMGVETINSKFETAAADILKRTKNRMKVVMALNVLAHTDTVHEFLDTVTKLVNGNDAVFVSVSHYLPNMIYGREYDTIYHEHARYYSLSSLDYLFKKHGLFIYDAEKISLYGGSILVYARNRPTAKTKRLAMLLKKEDVLQNIKTYRLFSDEVKRSREALRRMLQRLRKDGKVIAGIGAPMKSSTLLNYCGIGSDVLAYITELNQLKIGTYTPGTHIKVVDESRVFRDNPDACLILSWDVAGRIMKSFRKRGYKGSFIVPIPRVKLVK
jgi:2-polyprenyl-3-methyl-5-hydroxy-6-metoxy-1,4-benzoquinol methylase